MSESNRDEEDQVKPEDVPSERSVRPSPRGQRRSCCHWRRGSADCMQISTNGAAVGRSSPAHVGDAVRQGLNLVAAHGERHEGRQRVELVRQLDQLVLSVSEHDKR